jgi:DNA repair and recombination protein RAD54B
MFLTDVFSPQYLKKKKAELAALGEWTHTNCLLPSAGDDIQDDILRKLVYTRAPDTNNELAVDHKTRLDSLLSAVDFGNIQTSDEDDAPKLALRNVPGGTMSFLFWRSSKATLAPEADEG